MAGRFVKNWRANVVRPKNNFYGLRAASDPLCNTLKIGYKCLRVSLACERQQTKQVVRTETDGHTSRILSAAVARIEASAIHCHSFHGVNRDDLRRRIVRAVHSDGIFDQILCNFLCALVLDRNAD